MKIRPAIVPDVAHIHALIKEHASQGELLPRPVSELYEKVQDFVVMEDKKRIIACGGLHVSWEDLAEVRSLIVSPHYQRKGIGAKIVTALEGRAKKLKVRRVFALSFKPQFFKKLKYKKIDRSTLPHKVWNVCIKCPLFPNCGETALMKKLSAR